MSEIESFMQFFQQAKTDGRLTPTHLSLSLALFWCWQLSNYQIPFKVTRKILMELAKIQSTATYHKCMREMSAFGYIDYEPSYNHYKGSRVRLLICRQN